MHKVVLLRHGESVWNMENRFTGWTDVDLTQRGVEEAKRAGEMLKEAGFAFDCAYTSVLKRAIKTLWLALEARKRSRTTATALAKSRSCGASAMHVSDPEMKRIE